MAEEITDGQLVASPRRGRSAWYSLFIALALAIAAFGILEWRKHAINATVQDALGGETGAQTEVYRRSLLGGNDVVFDVKAVSGEMSMVDMTRRLLKTAEALQDHDFGRVYLAYKGQEKFYLDGPYFKQIGEERDWQNPVYTIRTMPENVYNPDGTKAFGTWTGGWLGVMGQQMDDNNEFHRKWWVDDALAGLAE